MFREKENVTRTCDGDAPGVAKGTVGEFGKGMEELVQTK